jgi:hypothetical protein
MSSKPVKLSAAVLFACAAIPLGIALLGGQSASAASKSVSCPDNTTGVKSAGWTVHCSGQSALKATVSITGVSMGVLKVKVKFPSRDTFVSANASFDKKKATSQIVLTSQSTGSQAYITITVSAPNGGPPKVVSVNKPVSTARAAADACTLSYAA